ncbi:hypothetical protein LDENG_00266110, partial [Lucifuga dentata]
SLKLFSLNTKDQVKNLGVKIKSDLNFENHIRNVTKVSFYNLRNIVRARPFLSLTDTEKLIHAFISSSLDYCNTLLSGYCKAIGRLQLVQKAAAHPDRLTLLQS